MTEGGRAKARLATEALQKANGVAEALRSKRRPTRRERFRFMNVMVCLCLGFTALMIVACYVGRWFGVDTSHELTVTATVFGGELTLMMVKKLTQGKKEGSCKAD